ncbi:MAG: glycosyltransferase [Deltaproteobacteria bacterium]
MKIDLHLHSKYSTRPSSWILRKLGCPESCSDPVRVYSIAKQRGMSCVTLTDHDTIEGCLDIAHLPDTFVSEEVTTYFPEDGCRLHVLVFDIDEEKHNEIQRVSPSVYELVEYLDKEQIPHAVAHPLHSLNGRLTLEHLERLLVLFKNFELSGARDHRVNECLKVILSVLTRQHLELFMEKYRLTPTFDRPWEKNFTAGSDDHASLSVARMYTEIETAGSIKEFFAGILKGEARLTGVAATPQTLAYNIYSLGFQYCVNRLHWKHLLNYDIVFRFFNKFLQAFPTEKENLLTALLHRVLSLGNYFNRKTSSHKKVLRLARHEIKHLITSDPELTHITRKGIADLPDAETTWFRFVNKVSSAILFHLNNRIVDGVKGLNPFDFFHFWTAGGVLYFFLSPYFGAFASFSKDRNFSQIAVKKFLNKKQRFGRHENPVKIAHFVDMLPEENGLAAAVHRQVQAAMNTNGKYTLLTCNSRNESQGKSVHNFKPLNVYPFAGTGGKKLYYPPLLEMINYCFEKNFTHIYSTTPGPVGLAALLVSRILKLPIVGTYHSGLAPYVGKLTDDSHLEAALSKYLYWYYNQMQSIHVPNSHAALELKQAGINPGKIQVIPVGVDTDRFNPSKRNSFLEKRYHVQGGLRVLYVGDVSRSKNVHLLVQAFNSLTESRNDVYLVVVGTGPYFTEMQESLKGKPCIFAGDLDGEDLASIYASCDLFVIPGNSSDSANGEVFEAQASGLPVVLTRGANGPEGIIPGETGLVIDDNSETSLLEAIQTLLSDPRRLHAMRKAARSHAQNWSLETTFSRLGKLFKS